MHKIVTPKREKPSNLTLFIQNGNRDINFHSRTVHRDIIKVLLPTDTQENCFKWNILKFTLKQLQHVSV